jgi:hypothetical protein
MMSLRRAEGFSALLNSACDLFLSAQNWKKDENKPEILILIF